jgi:hypothetical protein
MGTEARDDVFAQVSILVDGACRATVQAVGEPLFDGMGHGVARLVEGESVFVLTDLLPECVVRFGFGFAAGFADDALACRGVTDGD